MKSINVYLLALTLCFSGVATADHKPGHPPPTTGGDLSDLSCAEGQTVAFVGGVWVCADFPTLTGLVRVQADYPADNGSSLSATATQQVIASCPAGTKIVGGGYLHFYGGPTGVIGDNAPTIDSDGWIVAGSNFDGNPWRLSAVAMCADAE